MKMKRITRNWSLFILTIAIFVAILTVAFTSAGVSAAPVAGFGITKKIAIPGQGSWDYLSVDEAARRLYVSHGTQVEVIDVDSGSIVGSISKTPGVHGIAIAPELGRGFVSNGRENKASIARLTAVGRMAARSSLRCPLLLALALLLDLC